MAKKPDQTPVVKRPDSVSTAKKAEASAAKGAAPKAAPAKVAKRPNRVVRYFREVKAELQKVVWPSRQATLKLTGIVLAVTASMSVALGLVDWIFTKLFALIVG